MSVDWKESLIITLHKKSDKIDCIHYRGISLLDTAYKVLSIILMNMMKVYVEKIIKNHQKGFM